ncbi:MAG: thioredoxin [Methanomicrobia archaeon]|jgi:thioredoxin 1|nr:thioredoxin [Bacilli bacterium]NCA95566.1 thioredoxin [Methanomicrobia archaeon]
MLKHIENQEQFDAVLKEKKVLVDFYADWCGPCKMIGPVLEDVSKELGDKVTIAKVNVDKQEAIAAQYNIFSIPTMILFENGEIARKQVGFVPKAALIRFIG